MTWAGPAFWTRTAAAGPRGGIGHAFGYVYNRLMTGDTIPTVPIMLNTYYPPNQPTPKRCYNLGQALKSSIESWPKDIRVGILASGGLSHFVVDEELDQAALAGMQAKSVEKLSALPREKINSGSSEIRNWIVVTGRHRAPGHEPGGLRSVLPLPGRHRLRYGVRHLGIG